MKLRFLLLVSSLCLFTMISGVRAGSAQQVQPLEPEWLRQMHAEGWEKVQEGILRRDTGGGEYETFSYGAEGLQWVVEGYEQQLAFLEERYTENPSEDLAGLIEKMQGEIDKLSEDLNAAPSAAAFDGSALTECTEVAYGAQASAGPTSSPQGVTAASSAYFHTNCAGYVGDTFAVAYAEAINPATAVHTVQSQDVPLQGTWIDSSATASAPGSTGCYSWAQASVSLNGSGVFQTPFEENYACPLPVQVTITGPASVATDYYGSACADVTWTANATGGTPGYTYQWYIGTTPQGTGSTFTKSYCNVSKSETVKVVVTDAGGSQDTKTFTTNVQYTGPLFVSVSGPSSAATNSSTPCVNVTWTASASGAHPGYTYSWYLGASTTVQGTGSSFTKQYCNTSTSVTAKVTVRDADGHTATTAKATTITHTAPLTASIGGPGEIAISSPGECANITWTAGATGGASGYTYTWYLGTSTTAAGTGSSLTQNFCGAQTINVKVVARDSAGATAEATRTTTITYTPPANPLTVSISGPDTREVWSSTECVGTTWTANVSGGTPGYTYSWYVGSSTTVQSTYSSYYDVHCGPQTVNVTVTVSDSAGQTTSAAFTTRIVDVR